MAEDGQTVPRHVEEGFEIAGFEHSLYFIVMVFSGMQRICMQNVFRR